MWSLVVVVALLTAVLLLQTLCGASVVQTENGRVNGTTGSYFSNVTVYKGIPYATPPVGVLRWREPQPLQNWSGVLSADSFGEGCVQGAGSSVSGSEDCLFLNIWTTGANQSAALRPVYFWIHGGGFSAGSGSDTSYDGEGLASKGLVVVTINYRLGVLGFLALPELTAESGRNASGNYGLMDQIAALKWVQRNIAAFGGDPNKVTIGGQSAGAGSCYMLSMSPLAKGLFRGAIPESGGVFWPHDPEIGGLPSSHYSLAAGELTGLQYVYNVTGSNTTSLADLRNLTAEDIVGSSGSSKDFLDTETMWNGQGPLFHPVTDGYVLTHNYEETLRMGLQNDVAMLVGNNRDEWGADGNVTLSSYESTASAKYGNMSDEFLALYPADSDAEASPIKNAAVRDNTRSSTFLWSRLWLKSVKSPLYYYFWTYVASTATAAGHGSEICFFFGNLYANSADATEMDELVADTMSAYVFNFVSHLDPNGAGVPHWPRADGRQQVVMEVGGNYSLIPITDSANKTQFLENFYATQRQW